MTVRRTLALTLSAVVGAGVVLAAPAGAVPLASAPAAPTATAAAASTLRSDTVARAQAALTHPRKFKTSATSPVYLSTVLAAQKRNVLERGGSEANRNVFNGYNGAEWCGYFVAAMWTGTNVPDPAVYPRIPSSYPSSQAWMTQSGSRFHAFTGANQTLPKPGDVLVWTNTTPGTGGHVGLVVSVNGTTRTVHTIEGNVNGDEVAAFAYPWGAHGAVRSGKTFRGYTSRE